MRIGLPFTLAGGRVAAQGWVMENVENEAQPAVQADAMSAATPPKPTSAQLRYLRLGLGQPGGKLPLFDGLGQEINPKTIRACIEHGWAEPWFDNPMKKKWLVCKLTGSGRAIAGE